MAETNMTRKRLAEALRSMMQEMPFEKISVSRLCDRCGLNRKSFYYHFQDKYDLVNWIFDSETAGMFNANLRDLNSAEYLNCMKRMCAYFHENREFYCKALRIRGQNSFSEHFFSIMRDFLKQRIQYLTGREQVDDFSLDFFTDASICALARWLQDKNCVPPEQFVDRLVRLLTDSSAIVRRQVEAGE